MKRVRWVLGIILVVLGFARISLAQDQASPYYQAGNTFYAQKNYDQAIRYYQYAGQLNPNLWQAYQGLGNCYYAKGDKTTALTNYQKALAIHPANPSLASFAQNLQAQLGSAPPLPANTPVFPAVSKAGGKTGSGSGVELDVLVGGDFILGATNPVPSTLVQSIIPSGLAGGYGIGFGGGAGIYFPLDSHFSIGANTAFNLYGASYTYSSSGVTYGYNYTETVTESINQSNLEVLAAAKYRFDGNGFKPYLLAGGGFSLVSYSGSVSVQASVSGATNGGGIPILSGSQFCPTAQLGGGVEFPAGNNMNFFAEAKLEVVFIGSTNQTVSGSYSGYSYNGQYTSSAYTLLEVPVSVGLAFNL